MARRGSIAGIIMAAARESARQQRIAVANAQRAIREQKRSERSALAARREYERELKQSDKEAKARYLEMRIQQVDEQNRELRERLADLNTLLTDTLEKDDAIKFSSLRINDKPPKLSLPRTLTVPSPKPDEVNFLRQAVKPTGLAAIWPGSKRKYEQELANARMRFLDALDVWSKSEVRRLESLTNAELDHQKELVAFERKKAQRDEEVDAFEEDYLAGDPDAIVSYNTMVLERSNYPESFPHNFSIAYTSGSKQIVIEYELPTTAVVPSVAEYRYVKSSDTITERLRKSSEIRECYRDIVASIALRTIHEVFEAEQSRHLDVVCFNGYVHTVDPATGRDIQPHLISVRVTKERFREIDLARIDQTTCLRNLGAQVSRQPDEAVPVKPIVDFNMADARFIDQTDLVFGLSSATNLMDLNPYEFEQLVANVFEKMGLESRLTRSSRDGGVDCVAYDKRPVLGGKVVIQAKRYRHTVGVSAVRDLYGTMMNEGANKGILVTTSGYGPDAFDFAKDKPIELIDGGGMLFLLQEVGVQARIVFPEGNVGS
jgi:restriction system protein